LFRPMRDDQLWLKIDYSQIEYRGFAHYAGEMARWLQRKGQGDGRSMMEEAYVANARIDFHDWVTTVISGLTPDHPEFKPKRKRAKNVNFCKLYGGGLKKIAATAGCSLEEAKEFVELYEAKIPEAKAIMDDTSSTAARRGYIRTFSGRYGRFVSEGVLAMRKGTQVRGHPSRYAKTYAALNKVLQGSAGDWIKLAMIAVDKKIDYDDVGLSLTVHDELDFSVLTQIAEDVKRELVKTMESVNETPSWTGAVMRVPIIAEADLGPHWGMEIKEKKGISGSDPGGRSDGSRDRENEKRKHRGEKP
jgi:DNA polymerase-1